MVRCTGLFGVKRAPKWVIGVILGTTTLLLGACGSAAYVDSRREAGQNEPVGTSTADMVAICYSKSPATTAQVLKLAESECAKTGRVAQYQREERWTCTAVAPRRVFYSCVAKP